MLYARAAWLATSLALAPALASSQAADQGTRDWRFLMRATASGKSSESAEEEYRIHSGLAIEGAVARNVGATFAVELSLRTESREVEGPDTLPERRLGSLEVLPVNLTLKWQPREGSGQILQPFAGGGLNVTLVWEKSGRLDSTDPPISFNPVVQLGSHLVLSPAFMLTLDVKWHPLDMKLEGFADPAPTVKIDPLILGAGFGFTL